MGGVILNGRTISISDVFLSTLSLFTDLFGTRLKQWDIMDDGVIYYS